MPRSYTPRVESACARCGRVRLYRPCEVKKFCSHRCYAESRKGIITTPKIERPCERCGALMVNYPGQIGRYCSRVCADAAKIQDVSTRFWSKVGPPQANGCRDWQAGVGTDGYGKFWMDGRTVHASSAAFILTYGPVPPDKPYVCHTCNRPICCEPSHLYADTHLGNSRYMVEQGRSLAGDRHPMRMYPHLIPRGERHGSKTRPERVPRGVTHSMAKLTEADVVSIRERYAAGDINQSQLAREFGVTISCICAIVKRRSWTHI